MGRRPSGSRRRRLLLSSKLHCEKSTFSAIQRSCFTSPRPTQTMSGCAALTASKTRRPSSWLRGLKGGRCVAANDHVGELLAQVRSHGLGYTLLAAIEIVPPSARLPIFASKQQQGRSVEAADFVTQAHPATITPTPSHSEKVARRTKSPCLAPSRKFVAQWAQTRPAQRPDRGGVHRPRAGQGVRSPAEAEAEFRRAQRGALTASFGAQFLSGHHHAGDDVHREPQLRLRSPLSAACGSRPGRCRSARCRRSSSTPASSPSRSPRWRRWPTCCSPAWPPRSGSSSCSTPEQAPDPAAPARRRAAAGSSSSTCRSATTRPAAHRGPVAGRRAGPDRRHRRADRRRQDHAGQPDHAVLRAGRRPDHPRRRRHRRRCAATTCAAEIGMVLQDTWLFGGTIRDNIAYGRPGRHRGGDPRGRAGDLRRPLRALAAGRLRHGDRRGGQQRQRRRAAAAHDRAGVPRRPVAAHPRRGDQFGGHPHRGARPARDGRAARPTAPASSSPTACRRSATPT